MNTNFVNIIKRIIAEQGDDILANPQRLKGYVADYAAAESKAERLAFNKCIEAGAYNELKDAPDAAARQAVKAALAQRVHSSEGMDLALCNDALDALEAGMIEVKPLAVTAVVGTSPEEWETPTEPGVPVASTESVSNLAPETTLVTPMANATASAVTTASAKKHTLRNLLIAATVLIVAGIGIYVAAIYQPAKLDEYNQIIFTQIKNNDELVTGNLTLTLRDVKATQKFIEKNFPKFDFEEEGYVTDDYRNELLVKEFNSSPEYLSIYLYGIEGMAGKSQVYADLLINKDEKLLGYYFNIDQEFSDRSGFEYHSDFYPKTRKRDNGQIESIHLEKYLYTDINEPYWIIEWDDDILKRERIVLLKNFLNSLRYTKVFNNFALDFLKDVYTGIDKYQTIEDIVGWWGEQQSLSYTEEIYIEGWGRLHYVLSNYASEIEKSIYEQEGRNVDLDSLNWFINTALSQNVRTVMNRLDVDYSYPIKTNRIVNKRAGGAWYSAFF